MSEFREWGGLALPACGVVLEGFRLGLLLSNNYMDDLDSDKTSDMGKSSGETKLEKMVIRQENGFAILQDQINGFLEWLI